MKFKNAFLYAVSMAIAFIACTQENKHNEKFSTISIKDNKVYSMFTACDSNSNKEFSDFLGLKISSDFQIVDTSSAKFNSDEIPDYVVVLSPVIQEEEMYKTKCYKEPYNKRVLLILLSTTNGYSIHTVGENVVLSKDESQSEPFRKIIKTKDGFGLSFFIGSFIKCNYDFYFIMNKNNFYLDSSAYDCYKTDLSGNTKKSEVYSISDSMNVRSVNIRKYLKVPDVQ
jgi:hypothetical protein